LEVVRNLQQTTKETSERIRTPRKRLPRPSTELSGSDPRRREPSILLGERSATLPVRLNPGTTFGTTIRDEKRPSMDVDEHLERESYFSPGRRERNFRVTGVPITPDDSISGKSRDSEESVQRGYHFGQVKYHDPASHSYRQEERHSSSGHRGTERRRSSNLSSLPTPEASSHEQTPEPPVYERLDTESAFEKVHSSRRSRTISTNTIYVLLDNVVVFVFFLADHR
jgi:hypothetical protein